MKHKQSKHRRVFYLIAIALPFMLLGILELVLRVSGYGNSYPLFVPSQQIQGYLQPNPDIIKRFFYSADLAPSVAPDTYLFAAEKPKDTLRIVTLGGSTMAGFPYGRFGSPAGMLKQRISASHPELNVELISVAMSSINSFSLLDFSDEVIAISPDAVLIYAGHNEYLGVMGVGSSFAGKGSYGANLLFLSLKEWRLYQLLQQVYHLMVTRHSDGLVKTKDRTLMAQVAKEKKIAYQSELFMAGQAQFKQNLSLILGKFEAANITTYISTIASNEQDQAPFDSVRDDELDAAVKQLSKQAITKRQQEQSENLTALIDKNTRIFHADFSFAIAQQTLKDGQARLSAKHFTQAKDYDLLRFRAPSEFNEIILQSANDRSATLVDARASMLSNSPQGIIGNTLMLEHLHPNAYGYFVIAEAFYQQLIAQKTLPEPMYAVSPALAWQWQPISKVDATFAALKIAQLMSDYPFNHAPRQVSIADIDTSELTAGDRALLDARINGDSFIDVQQRLIESLQREQRFLEAGLAAGVLFEALPTQHQLARIASLLLLRENALPLAQYFAMRALDSEALNPNYKLTLAEILYKLNRVSDAIALLDEVIAQEPSNIKAQQIRSAISL